MSELRDDFAVCPHCKTALDPTPDRSRYGCGNCKGIQIGEPALLAVIGEVVKDPPTALPLEEPRVEEPVAICPHCTTAMTKHMLYSIQIDRCAAHGIWFDGNELQRILERLGMEPVKRARLEEGIVAGAATVAYIAVAIAQLVLMK